MYGIESACCCLMAEDLKRWEKELDDFPEYKAEVTEKAKRRQAKQQEQAAKKQIFKAAKKRPTRPGKMGLPKVKPIVKNGQLTRKTRAAGTKTSKKPQPNPKQGRKVSFSKP